MFFVRINNYAGKCDGKCRTSVIDVYVRGLNRSTSYTIPRGTNIIKYSMVKYFQTTGALTIQSKALVYSFEAFLYYSVPMPSLTSKRKSQVILSNNLFYCWIHSYYSKKQNINQINKIMVK